MAAVRPWAAARSPRRSTLYRSGATVSDLCWDRWEAILGICPRCEGLVRGYAFGMGPETGGVVGCCTACAHYAVRAYLDGRDVARAADELLEHTPYRLSHIRLAGISGAPGPLLEALHGIGAADVPDIS